MFLSVNLFQAEKQARKTMNAHFKRLGYSLENKRFVMGEALGYVSKLNDLTVSEMEEINRYLETK